jgi:hypothetical protein
MKQEWQLTGGYGWNLKTDHAYTYKYMGGAPQPVNQRWKLVAKKGNKKIKMYFKTQHEALEKAVKFLF